MKNILTYIAMFLGLMVISGFIIGLVNYDRGLDFQSTTYFPLNEYTCEEINHGLVGGGVVVSQRTFHKDPKHDYNTHYSKEDLYIGYNVMCDQE